MKLIFWTWPKIKDIETAKKAAHQGCIASGIIIIGDLIHSMRYIEYKFIYTVIDVIVFTIIGIAIFFISEIAVVLGLILFLLSQLYMFVVYDYSAIEIILLIILILMFINSIRGTFSYHKYKQLNEKAKTNT